MQPNTTQSMQPALPRGGFDLDTLEEYALKSKSVAWCLIAGLPALGLLLSLAAALPLFAALMSACFLLATSLVCRQALVTFTSRTLRLLVTARLVLILVLGGLLFCTSGNAWVGVVSATLLWLTADRLLGRSALHDLGKLTRSRP